jgi:hypothetical protein
VRVVARTVIFMALRWASVTSGLACNCCTSGRATVSAVAREWSLEMAAALAEACAVSFAGKAASQAGGGGGQGRDVVGREAKRGGVGGDVGGKQAEPVVKIGVGGGNVVGQGGFEGWRI